MVYSHYLALFLNVTDIFSLSSQQGGLQGDLREAGLRGGGEHVFRAVGHEGK